MNPVPDQPHGPCWSSPSRLLTGFTTSHLSQWRQENDLRVTGKHARVAFSLHPPHRRSQYEKSRRGKCGGNSGATQKNRWNLLLSAIDASQGKPASLRKSSWEKPKKSAAGTMNLCASGHSIATIRRAVTAAVNGTVGPVRSCWTPGTQVYNGRALRERSHAPLRRWSGVGTPA